MSTILLVEDEAGLRDAITSLLEEEGFTVIPAVDGHEALHLLSAIQPSLVLTDIMMPRVDGRELLKRLRSTRKWETIPVIVVSAVFPSDPDNFGIQAFLAKPFDLDVLLQTIRDVLDQPV